MDHVTKILQAMCSRQTEEQLDAIFTHMVASAEADYEKAVADARVEAQAAYESAMKEARLAARAAYDEVVTPTVMAYNQIVENPE